MHPQQATPTETGPVRETLPAGVVARLGELRFYHGCELRGVAFVLDGRLLVSLGQDGIVRIWDPASGQERNSIGEAKLRVENMAVAAGGRSLLMSNSDGSFCLWDIAARRELKRWRPASAHTSDNVMSLSQDGKLLATAGLNDRTVALWDLETPGLRGRLDGAERDIWDVAFSPDRRLIAWAAMDGIPGDFATTGARGAAEDRERGSVRIQEWESGKEISRIPVTGYHPRSVAFSPDGQTLAASFSDSTVRFYDPIRGNETGRLNAGSGMQGCLAFAPSGRVLASGTHPHRSLTGVSADIYLWDVTLKKELHRFPAHDQYVAAISFSPDGRTLASCGADVALRTWDVATGRELNPSLAPRTGLACLCVSPIDDVVVTGGADRTIRRWDPASGRELSRFEPFPAPVNDLAISSSGQLILAASLDGTIVLRDVPPSQTVPRALKSRRAPRAAGVDFSPDGRLATGDGRIWDVATGRELAVLQDRDGKRFVPWLPASVRFTPDSRSLVSTSTHGVRLWEAETGRLMRIIGPADVSVTALALSPDGRFVAAAVKVDFSIRLFHLASGRELARFGGRGNTCFALAFSPDGRLLASGEGNYSETRPLPVRLWEVISGQEVRRFDWHRAGVTSLAFFRDGRRLVSSSADATAIVWDITPPRQSTPPPSVPLDIEQRWNELADGSASTAYQAIWAMASDGSRVVPFLMMHLNPVAPDDATSDTSLGPIASGETLRRLRAIAVLEKIGTRAARTLLARLTSGLEGARETRDAKATLRRLKSASD